MLAWLKKHFIPHGGNDHRPHILRDYSVRNIVILVLFLEIFSFLIPTLTNINFTGGMAAVLPAVLGDLTNSERSSQNLPTLAVNPILTLAAEMKARDMATKGYFAHTSPEGLSPWYWLQIAGYKYQYAGENLAVNFSDSKDVTNAWMNSPGHRANIVKGNYTEMGTGIAEGTYKGRNTIFVAQVYANPLYSTPVKLASTPKSNPTPTPTSTTPPPPPSPKPFIAFEQPINILGEEAPILDEAPSPVATFINSLDESESLAEPVPTPSVWQRLVASPRNTTNIFLAIIFAIVALGLLLYLLIKRKEHHIDLLTNGFAVIAIIGAIFTANYHYSHESMIITQSLDYSLEEN
jgi:hypothetical protein